ncbi:MAG: transcriptional repressor LexA [Planctomycetota bacterium]
MQILRTISSYQVNRCYSPTIAELAQQLRISRSTAFEHTSELRKKGMVTANRGKARSLMLTTKAQRLLKNASRESLGSLAVGSKSIRLLGRVAAGEPIDAIEDTEQFSLQSQFGSSDDIFALQVAGDSMTEDDIQDGDYVICQSKPNARAGQMVVAAVDDESVTLKRFYKEKDRVRLEPANSQYAPIYSNNCRIQAVVIGLLRKF